jgi:UDP-N-acetylmuramoyl-L-alanyl-D-glutamate--2,6-diaminopimelate ligase
MLGVKDFSGQTLKDLGVTRLASDSRKVKPGYLFAALAGTKTDGARFVKDAVSRGAVAVMGAPALADEVAALGVRFIPEENPRAALAHMASAFFTGQPETVAAVTGTKGKSSIVAFLRESGRAGRPPAWERWGGGPKAKSRCRTPRLTRSRLRTAGQAEADGVDHLAIEASSHGGPALSDGVKIAACGFTNITRDHMDYHPPLMPIWRPSSGCSRSGAGRRWRGQCRCRPFEVSSPPQRRGAKLITVGRKGDTITRPA